MTDRASSSHDDGPGPSDPQAGAPSGAPVRNGGAPVVALRGLSKSFGGARALDNVNLTINRGEIHGLLGENGSGKSTLIKVLAGFHAPDEGTLEINGQPVSLPLAPGQFATLGLSFVHQDLGLLRELTVLENLRMIELAQSRSWRIDWRTERRRARELFAEFDVPLDPDALVNDITETDRALLAIVRAVEDIRKATGADRRGLLVLDEPTVFLPREGVERLFAITRSIVEHHASVLFVGHDLDEVREITHRVTVLRDGKVHGTVVTKDATEAELVEMIIGRRLAQLELERPDVVQHETAISVKGLIGTTLAGMDFDVRKGEVLGVTGLLGSGFDELPYLLFGARSCFGGELTTPDATYNLATMTPQRALAAGIALIPADRQRDGAVGSLPIWENVMMQVMGDYQPMNLQLRKMHQVAGELLQRFDVRPSDPRLVYQSLSGGNQQKALLAKWMQTDPGLILLHEPTQGVDVGARQQIFEMLSAAAEGGMSIICASSDYEQLAAICDRVLVVGNGRIVRELTGSDVVKDRIAEQVYNSVTLAEAE
ncbi:sugar ABC transporter ATP-binding protein [Baekduia soli]|uniref:Sugar ABC transporter ATP-binding protein n=1 Tax=Baekduia soli TaxID=496014 RepID=A0A5B8U5T2_9ACTN|nr:sugar ABC transporter ATP-binding protein [Baekduia soli]QEC48443.1 sugar ABC transporter ATP-binding protein [Baekduia soli]